MKKGIIAVMALTIAFILPSCGKKGGMSEESKTALTTFETSWKSTEDQVMKFGESLDKASADHKKMDDDMMKGMDMSKMKPAEKASMDSMMMMCETINNGMASVKTEYTAALDEWKADSQAYADWKKKGMDEGMTDEEIMTGLTDWNTKLAAWNTRVADWNTKLASMEATCKMNHEMGMMHHDM